MLKVSKALDKYSSTRYHGALISRDMIILLMIKVRVASVLRRGRYVIWYLSTIALDIL